MTSQGKKKKETKNRRRTDPKWKWPSRKISDWDEEKNDERKENRKETKLNWGQKERSFGKTRVHTECAESCTRSWLGKKPKKPLIVYKPLVKLGAGQSLRNDLMDRRILQFMGGGFVGEGDCCENTKRGKTVHVSGGRTVVKGKK